MLGKIGPFAKASAVRGDRRRAILYANVDGLLGFEIAEIVRRPWGGRVIHRVEAHTPPERLAEIPDPPKAKPHSTPSHGLNLTPNQKEVWIVDGVYGYVRLRRDVVAAEADGDIPIFADAKARPHPGWITFSIDGRYAHRTAGRDRHRHQVGGRANPDQRETDRD